MILRILGGFQDAFTGISAWAPTLKSIYFAVGGKSQFLHEISNKRMRRQENHVRRPQIDKNGTKLVVFLLINENCKYFKIVNSKYFRFVSYFRFDVVQMKDASIRAAENVLIENEAFQDIKESHW